MLYSRRFVLEQAHEPRLSHSKRMTDTGLSNRLRQHSRRSGIAVGLTMAATIALCILTSAYIFGRIEPYVAEVTGYDEPTAIPEVAVADETPEPDEDTASENQADAGAEPAQPTQQTEPGQPTVAPAEPTESTTFEATHSSNPNFTVNFRPGPSISSGEPIDALSPGSPLQYLDEETLDEEGVVWLRMETSDGLVGWIREVDTELVNE
jgi:hypothetical protein